MNKKSWKSIYILSFAVFVLVVLISITTKNTAKEKNHSNLLEDEINRLIAERAWYRWYFSEYAAALRLSQYAEPTLNINSLLHSYRNEFIPIKSVTSGIICSAPANSAFTNEHIYFGARTMPLQNKDGFKMYAMSYLGSAEWAHSGKAFDALLSEDDLKKPHLKLSKPFGLIDSWLSEHSWKDFRFKTGGSYGDSALMSYNSGDIDGDGKADFVLESWLVLSSLQYSYAGAAPRRAMFIDNSLIAVEEDILTRYVWINGELKRIAETKLRVPTHPNIPYVVMPLPDSKVAVRNEDSLDIYNVTSNHLVYFATITGFAPGEVQTGAFGDFTGDGNTDVWLSQVATPTPYPNKKDQLVLLNMSDISPGKNKISDIVWFTIRGSSRYSDYDGIGTTVSPIAGDIMGDGRPDLSFSGHRHMNESGALYILPGANIKHGGDIDITSKDVIKILGRSMSQLAPPFHHWDAEDITGDGYSDIVIAVDNDLCAGLNAGSIYTLSGKAIAEKAKNNK